MVITSNQAEIILIFMILQDVQRICFHTLEFESGILVQVSIYHVYGRLRIDPRSLRYIVTCTRMWAQDSVLRKVANTLCKMGPYTGMILARRQTISSPKN